MCRTCTDVIRPLQVRAVRSRSECHLDWTELKALSITAMINMCGQLHLYDSPSLCSGNYLWVWNRKAGQKGVMKETLEFKITSEALLLQSADPSMSLTVHERGIASLILCRWHLLELHLAMSLGTQDWGMASRRVVDLADVLLTPCNKWQSWALAWRGIVVVELIQKSCVKLS